MHTRKDVLSPIRPQVLAQSRTTHSNRNAVKATDVIAFYLIFL